MPRKDPAARAAYDKERRVKINGDSVLLEKKRKRNREYMRKRMQDPKLRAQAYAQTRAWREREDNGIYAHVKNKHGVSADEYRAMFTGQHGVCAVCGLPESAREQRANSKRGVRRLAVDHDHATGKIRGLLCYRCNVGIGFLGHDAARLHAAIAYLKGGTACVAA